MPVRKSLVTLPICHQGTKLGAAFCSDLEAGAAPAAIQAANIRNGETTPKEAADNAYAWAARNCPDQLKTNDGLRSYLENWNINPDA